ncbi:MAG: aldehyde dehydrogenase family protein [Sphingomonadaceae bacterium]|uniref:aldehyde dehydrogenase family protein n=1 Tax=Thermaurantiacus sp. TaxID=2820283 RepID=UPI00298F2654|nr:aldehyde dehydrogenase family protein [Thermaurantiacus sp.]MCS6986761.1 aldehyde dehydrogenase family protein [Sphingomonadaceae bacterium]MDW8413976.1 aldehyde dehydrogenase family protein [Thermaurantiacus sp.]
MREAFRFYIDGEWVEPVEGVRPLEVINPATERPMGRIALGTAADVDRAVKAAAAAFPAFARTTRQERLELLEAVLAEYQKRYAEIAAVITEEMGAPSWLAQQAQAALGAGHLQTAIAVLRDYRFEEERGTTLILKEPVGVCGFITPWNWPINQIACKVAPALAVGCTMVLKPSEVAPFNAVIWAEVMHAAGVPKGVFNLVNGDGPTVGAAIAAHPLVDMVSFTGSTRAGIEVARTAAPTVKRVHQELGGKSPNIILPSADLAKAVAGGVQAMMLNSGQSCNAPSRMFVPRPRLEEAKAIAKSTAEGMSVGDPKGNHRLGPVVSKTQFDRIQGYIAKGIEEGATLVTGGLGRPEGLEVGYYVRPTVFADVRNDMTIAREEIFGPVLCMLAYDTVDEAIALGNDTPYGLAAYVQGAPEEAREVARRLRAGQVTLNGAGVDLMAPFGGYKQSGNGREWGDHAFAEFLETKAVIGWGAAAA